MSNGKLVITRSHGQSIRVGDDIQITIEIQRHPDGDRVRMICDAPKEVKIRRAEVGEKK